MRRPLQPSLTFLAASVLAALASGCGGGEPVTFTHGVAAGDVREDSAVLWTRVDGEARLVLQVALEETFSTVVVERAVEAEETRDYTAKTSVAGLEPSTQYYYRFQHRSSLSETGTFRTAPRPDEAAPVRFVFSGDSDGASVEGSRVFDFHVLDRLRAQDPDFFIYLGDTIYADSPYAEDATTLEAFRDVYKTTRSVPPLQATLASTSTYVMWDDHEVRNNYAGSTVEPALYAAGLQAFREYMPISGDEDPETLYRSFRWGSAVELILLDERSFRSPDVSSQCVPEGGESPDILPGLGGTNVPEPFRDFRSFIGLPEEAPPGCLDAMNDTSRTMLGIEQKGFLLQALANSEAMFKFVINPVPMSELLTLPYDRWEGYRAERDEIIRHIRDEGIENVIFLTTDFHANIVSDVRLNLASAPAAVEFITGPIAHDTLADDIAEAQGPELVAPFEALLKGVAGVDCAEFDAFSFGLVEVDPEARTATIALVDEDGNLLCGRVIEAA